MQPNNLAKEVRKLLPGTDCTGRGGCGFATCDECAAAIAEGGPANLCPACKEEDIAAIVALTGGELVPARQETAFIKCSGCAACTVSCRKKIIVDTYHDLTKLKSTVSFVRCRGGWHNHEVYAKAGATSCREAVKMALDGHCNYGCAGFGDCVKACRFDALEIVQGTAKVNPDKCVGCTACVHVCPQELPVIVPYKGAKMVPCASKDDPEVRKQLCWVGCIGCGDCVDNCPDGLIHLEDGRAVIEPDRCEDCNICSYVCPNGVITAREMPEFTYVQVRAMAAQKGGAAK